MRLFRPIVVLAFFVGGCEQTLGPQKEAKPAADSTNAVPPVAAKVAAPKEPTKAAPKPAVEDERRANGPGFTVALAPKWEPRTQAPNMFGANRGPTISIQISAPSKNPIRANYLAAARDAPACDDVFSSLGREMQAEFTRTKNAGCERELSMIGRTMLALIREVEGRPIFAMCGGEGDRASWEPECRDMVASVRWDPNATPRPVEQPAAKTETLADGRTRVNAGGIEATLLPGWSLRPEVPDVKFTAMRVKGFGLLTASIIDAGAKIQSATDCRERALEFAADSGVLTSSKLDRGRCSFTLTMQDQAGEMVLAPGRHGDTLALGCMWAAKDKQVAAECSRMLADVIDRRIETPLVGNGRPIPNASGLFVEAPPKWQDNGIGGAPGMHLQDNEGLFVILETSPEQAAKNFETIKKDMEQVLFKQWLSAEKTADGYKLLYVVHNVVMKNDEPVKEGSRYAFQVRRKIGEKLYDCSGATKTEANAKEGLELCTKITEK